MPEFVYRENGYLWRVPELQTSGIVQKGILENTSLLESGLVAYIIYHTELHTKGYCYKQEVAIVLIVLSHDRGNPLVLTSVLFIANLLYKRRVILTSSVQ